MKALSFFTNDADPFVKLQMFNTIDRFYIMESKECLVKSKCYFRVSVQIMDKLQKKYFEGMAEGHTRLVARLRATAEAYEKACFFESLAHNSNGIDIDFPYGLGVGFRNKSAILRAYGEYYERLLYTKMLGNLTPTTQKYRTKSGDVFVSFVVSKDGIFGSGYGLTSKLALDSANRAALRYRDFEIDIKKYKVPVHEPSVIRMTTSKEPWLECYYVGQVRS